MPDVDKIFSDLSKAVIDLAKKTFSDYADEAEKDVKDFLTQSKQDIKEYTQKLSEGKLTPKEYESLLKGVKSLAEMKLLKQQGIALVTIDKFQNQIIQTIVGIVKAFIPI